VSVPLTTVLSVTQQPRQLIGSAGARHFNEFSLCDVFDPYLSNSYRTDAV